MLSANLDIIRLQIKIVWAKWDTFRINPDNRLVSLLSNCDEWKWVWGDLSQIHLTQSGSRELVEDVGHRQRQSVALGDLEWVRQRFISCVRGPHDSNRANRHRISSSQVTQVRNDMKILTLQVAPSFNAKIPDVARSIKTCSFLVPVPAIWSNWINYHKRTPWTELVIIIILVISDVKHEVLYIPICISR